MHQERKRLLIRPDFPTCVFIWGFYCLWKLSQANTMHYLFGIVFWKRKSVISRQSAVMCELARQFSTSALDGAPWRVAGWTMSGKQWPETLGEWAAFVWAVPAPALCLICCLSIKTIIWPPLPDFVNLSNGGASAEYRIECVSCCHTDNGSQTILGTPKFLRSVKWCKPLDPALGHMNTCS